MQCRKSLTEFCFMGTFNDIASQPTSCERVKCPKTTVNEHVTLAVIDEGRVVQIPYTCISETTGRKLEKELNESAAGESFFVLCDIRKEQDLKVQHNFASQMS